MLKVDLSLTHISLRKEQILALHESVNQPLVNIPGIGTAPTVAYVIGSIEQAHRYSVYVYLRQPQTSSTLIYVSEPRLLSSDQYVIEENEARRFVESMGFVMETIQLRAMPLEQQIAELNRIPVFRPDKPVRPDRRTLDLIDLVPVENEARPRNTAVEQNMSAVFGSLNLQEQEPFVRAGILTSSSVSGIHDRFSTSKDATATQTSPVYERATTVSQIQERPIGLRPSSEGSERLRKIGRF